MKEMHSMLPGCGVGLWTANMLGPGISPTAPGCMWSVSSLLAERCGAGMNTGFQLV